MKTPSFLLLLVLFAALPAAAEPKPGQRCDTAFLEKVVNDFKVGGIVTDERIVTKSANGVTIPALKFGEGKTCDAGTWRFLASGTPLVWRSADAGKYWDASNAGPNAAVVLVADDFFKAFDPEALKVLAAADAVIEAGVQLGVITTADSPKPLSELLKGASGGAFGALKPKTITAVPADKQTAVLPPDQIGKVLRRLLDETGAAKGGGSAVTDFRMAVLALNAEIGRLGKSGDAVAKRTGADLRAVKDFMPGLPQGYVAAKVEKAAALDDVKFGAALQALIGAGVTPALDDAAPRAGSLLEPVDLGLRNLVAIRAAQVEQIVAAAKPRLKGKTITQIEVAARTAGEASKQPANSLSAAVVQRLAESPEYMKLDALYENNKRERGDAWTKSPEAQGMLQAREQMLEAAKTATVETAADGSKSVVFTQNGKKVALTSVVPSAVEGNASVRNDVAGMISRFIVDGAKGDARNAAVWAAIGGSGQPGQTLDTGLSAGEGDLARTLPPESKKIKDGAAGCDNPKDLIRNDYETYAARKRAAAADMASGNVKSRGDVEKKRLEQLAASEVACKKKKDEAAAIKQDYFDDPAIAKAAREKAAAEAEAWCVADKKGIEEAAAAKIQELAKAEAGDRDPAKVRAAADAELAVAFGAAVLKSVDALRKDYTTAGSPRLKKLAAVTGNSPKLVAFTTLWFDKEWPRDDARQKDLQAAVSACSKELGLGDESNSPSYHNPDNPDSIDKYCKVNEKLTKYIADSKGSNRPVP
jgi:hypothetical protein